MTDSIFRPYSRLKPEERLTRQAVRASAVSAMRARMKAEGQIACEACGWATPVTDPKKQGAFCGLSFHHILPVSEGGTDEASNLILLCACCHAVAHPLHIEGDRTEFIDKLRNVLVRRTKGYLPRADPEQRLSPILQAKVLTERLLAIWDRCHRSTPGSAVADVKAIREVAWESYNEWGWRR